MIQARISSMFAGTIHRFFCIQEQISMFQHIMLESFSLAIEWK